jgi:HSP20 family molecular chaperone IbpA
MARIETSVEVNVPVLIVYDQLTRFEQFPRFMEGVQEVRRTGDNRLHWRMTLDAHETEWDTEITEKIPGKCIAWRHADGLGRTGRIDCEALGDERTKLTFVMEMPSSGPPSLAQQPDNRVALRAEHDLARFKKLIETRFQEISLAHSAAHAAHADAPQQAAHATDTAHTAASDHDDDRGAHAHAHDHDRTADAPHAGHQGRRRNPLEWLPHPPGLHGNPLAAVRKMGEEVDHLVERVLGRPLGKPSWIQGERHWSPRVDVTQHGDEVVICADLPGMKCEDIRVEIRRDRLTIEGDRQEHMQRQDRHARRTERAYGHFYREIPLPEGADPDAAAASMHDGVLEIKMPMLPEDRRRRRLEINAPH